MDLPTKAFQEHIEKYLTERSNQSLRSVSLRAGIPYSSLWRIYQGNGTVDFGMAMSVINIVASASDAGKFLQAHFPEKAKIAHEMYSQHRPGIASDLFREHLSNYLTNQIFSLAATRAGTTEERVRHLYGEKGSAALTELIESEILIKSDTGAVKFPTGNFSISNPEDFISDFSLKVKNFDKSLLGTNGALLGTITETVNEDSLAEIKSILVESYKRINEIVLSKESEGILPVFAGVAMTLLDKTDFKGKTPEGNVK